MALVTDNFRIYAAENLEIPCRPPIRCICLWVEQDLKLTCHLQENLLIVSSMRELPDDSVAFKRVDISDTTLVVRVDWVDPTKTTGGVGRTYSCINLIMHQQRLLQTVLLDCMTVIFML